MKNGMAMMTRTKREVMLGKGTMDGLRGLGWRFGSDGRSWFMIGWISSHV